MEQPKPVQENKRKVARKLHIRDVLSATYIKRPGWDPSGILTKYGEVSRINIVGIIVSINSQPENTSFLVDDGTGNISVRFFQPSGMVGDFSLGDLVKVVGRPREWGNDRYIFPEIVKKISDTKWHTV